MAMGSPSSVTNESALAEDRRAECVQRNPVCPVCGGPLFEIRSKLQCATCHTICETCCEGGRG